MRFILIGMLLGAAALLLVRSLGLPLEVLL